MAAKERERDAHIQYFDYRNEDDDNIHGTAVGGNFSTFSNGTSAAETITASTCLPFRMPYAYEPPVTPPVTSTSGPPPATTPATKDSTSASSSEEKDYSAVFGCYLLVTP